MRKLIKGTVIATAWFTTQGQAMENEPFKESTLASEISASTLNQEQQTPIEDPIYFTIRNETCGDMPVDLIIQLFEHHDIIHNKVNLFSRSKVVKAYSESTFRQSESVLFKWAIDSYISKKPDNCELYVWMVFNMQDILYKRYPKIQSVNINPYDVPYGRTYVIKPTERSFDIKLL